MTLTQLIDIILDSKMSENSDFIRITYYEIKIKCNLSNEQCDEFIRLAKIKLENMNYRVYLQDEKYTYENANRTVQINEVLIAIRKPKNKKVNKKGWNVMIKNYLPIGSARLLDVRVIMDDQVIYDGLVDKAPDDIKQLKYYDISFDGNKVEYKVTNE